MKRPKRFSLPLTFGHRDRTSTLVLEQQLDRRLDLGLGGVVGDAEHVLVVLVGDAACSSPRPPARAAPASAVPRCILRRGHLNISSNLATAPWSAARSRTAPAPPDRPAAPSSTSTLGRLREDRYRFSSSSSVMTSTLVEAHRLQLLREQLGLGLLDGELSTTRRRSSRASCDRIDAMPARYILRFTFCVKFSSGVFGKILPPPRHSGLEVMPARARPVPFWRHGFLRRVAHFAAVLLRARAEARVRLVGDHDLVHQRLVVVAPEQRRPDAATVAAPAPLSLMSLSSIIASPLRRRPCRRAALATTFWRLDRRMHDDVAALGSPGPRP